MIIVVIDTVTPPVGVPELPPPSQVREFAVAMVGTDGSVWDLSQGPVHLLNGASGFGAPAATHRFRETPSIDGSAWLGMRTGAREFTLPVAVSAPSSLQWRDTDGDLFAALDPRGLGRLVVTAPDASYRWLEFRYVDGGDIDFEVDPMKRMHAAYALELMAAEPFWQGPAVGRRFEVAADTALFPGPSFGIIPASNLSTATVTNPGDEPAFPRWTITGPFDGFTAGVADSVTQWSGAVATGSSVVIDTDPRKNTVLRDGADGWDNIGVADFVSIPAGIDVPLRLELVGAGPGASIELSFTPRYRKAWGRV